MATIFYKTGGNFSALTPQLVTASYLDISSGGAHYNALSTERYMAFTPSDAGNAEGVFLCLYINSGTVTVKLQEYVGAVWTDRASATVTHTTMLGSELTINTVFTWVYIPFTAPYAVTTADSTWRIAVSGTSSWWYNGSNYNYALVLATTTSYTSGDNILVNGDITITMDQSVTCNWLSMGNLSTWTWGSSPAASYTLDCEYYTASRGSTLSAGTALNPISAANMAVVDINAFDIPVNWAAQPNPRYKFYGAKPTDVHTYLAADANASQKNIVTSSDMTGKWSVGDTLVILGGKSTTSYSSDTIASISGTTITMTSNLAKVHMAGFCVYNDTKKASCGVWLKKSFYINNLGTMKMSGVRADVGIYADYYSAPSAAAYEAPLFDTVFLSNRAVTTGVTAMYTTYLIGGTYSNVYTYSSTWNANFVFTNLIAPTMSHIYNGIAGVGGDATSISGVGGTFSYIQATGSYSTYPAMQITNSNGIFTNIKTYCNGNTGLKLAGSGMTFTDSDFEDTGTNAIYLAGNTDAIFDNCTFAQNTVCTAVFSGDTYLRNTILINNSSDFTVDAAAMALFVNSYIKSHTYDDTANDHRSWWSYGKMQSTGDGLTDTTVHTSGTGKFALRFEPTSSTSNLEWDFTVPTGNIQNKTMTIGVWCKINSATYYAGTHQLPRLTIDYDNGTTAYAQAAESTDWQLLYVAFTPTTTYGQITVTLSARTDATTTNAYVYWDDFTVAYPPSVALDLGGMDNWANALPVTPPIALPISAGTVAQNVWTQLSTTDWGTDTMGEQLKVVDDKADIADAVWDESTSGHSTAGTFGKITGKKIVVIDGGEVPIYES